MDQTSVPDPSVPPPAGRQPTLNDSMSQLDVYAERLRVQLPVAPPGLLDGYMRFAPWVAIVFGALGVLGLLGLMGLGAVLTPFMIFGGVRAVGAEGVLFVALIVGLVSAALELVGGYLMLQRSATGWWLLALGMVVSLLTGLVQGGLVTVVLVLLIAYVHLQVKPNYH